MIAEIQSSQPAVPMQPPEPIQPVQAIQPGVSLPALERAISRMTLLAPLDEAVVAALRTHVTTAEDRELLHLNPLRFARDRGLLPQPTVDAFVAGVRAGLLQFAWTLTCPMCGMFSMHMPRLCELTTMAYCALCNVQNPAVLDQMVEVRFRVDPSVRALCLPSPTVDDAAACLDRFLMFKNPDAILTEIAKTMLGRLMLRTAVLPPGETVTVPMSAEPGGDGIPKLERSRLVAISHDVALELAPPEGFTGAEVRMTPTGLQLERYLDEPVLRLRSELRDEAVLGLMRLCQIFFGQKAANPVPRIQFGEALTGKRLLCSQVFRDLFAAETLSAGIALQVENVTLLFTDLKGSTALYDAVGDVRAFSLVSDHFKILLRSVRDHGGAVVKTIGDAVMGVFADPRAALAASLDMADKLRVFNQELAQRSHLPPLSLKVGVHCGPCIVVTSNERLDYFGQTVNVAARVQGLADGDQIVLTDACYSAPGVAELCQHLPRSAGLAALKGVGEPVKVHTLAA